MTTPEIMMASGFALIMAGVSLLVLVHIRPDLNRSGIAQWALAIALMCSPFFIALIMGLGWVGALVIQGIFLLMCSPMGRFFLVCFSFGLLGGLFGRRGRW